ncbi:MAG: DegT/DnrJ/EryC1/StrS family aminotransferase [Paramuribaculum sp.]|nr:DegT/DnrJ/EryC1/StrS family aminotransferase [Paramuribaculum sp.]
MIKFLDLKKINELHADEMNEAINRVVSSGQYLFGEETSRFEKNYADYIGTTCCVGCGNGLDALYLILRGYIELGTLSPGDEVIVPANTYIASIMAITQAGLVPVLVEPDIATLQISPVRIKESITQRTKAVMIVHLYGRCSYSQEIAEICGTHKLLLIEDNAQAHGCYFENRRTGSLGNAAAHSFYPGKNLGALGDGGAITTDDEQLARTVRTLANYGSEKKYFFSYIGRNSRLDEIQAAILNTKLKYLDAENQRREQIAGIYTDGIKNQAVTMPAKAPKGQNVFHLFPILTDYRDSLWKYLLHHGVETLIHYPIPPHRQKCYPKLNDCSFPVTEQIHSSELSLPVSPVLTCEEAHRIVSLVNRWIPDL